MRLGMGLSVLVGGARSGKSDLAVKLGEAWPDEVVMVATATAGDEDMAARIARHQQERPASWTVVESPMFAASDVASVPADALMILDCLTMLVSNLFFADIDADNSADKFADGVLAHVESLSAALADRPGPALVISNEVGLGIHPPNEMSRTYRDLLGRCNRRAVERAESSLLVVAGRVVALSELEIKW